MFKITSTRAIDWAGFDFKLHRGDNVLESPSAVPAELRGKLERFRKLGLVAFEDTDWTGTAKLADLTEVQLFAKDKAALADLAKAEGISVPDGASKKQLVEALVPKCKPRLRLEDPAPADDKKAEAGKPEGAKRGGKPSPTGPVSGSTTVTG